ncbi:hypothetical protein [Solidesulfovibrio sp.]|uniref:hypothetical protein n=1 Tax=Solidesulfovibrio sp. TaxID=2910990 RepID=UPI002B2042F2|nr:hypothetical protein [Solidesulfovibrio sp.]
MRIVYGKQAGICECDVSDGHFHKKTACYRSPFPHEGKVAPPNAIAAQGSGQGRGVNGKTLLFSDP